jgi:type IV secretion system protein VirB9
MKAILIAVALCAGFASVQAAEVPRPGALDFRVRTTDYTEGQVYKITGFFGFHALVLFGEDERIDKVGGFEKGWTIDDLGNKVLIAPKVEDADSNLTVVTNRRVYFFDLSVKPFPKGKYRSQADDALQTYGLRFRYPEDEARAAVASAEAQQAERHLREAGSAPDNKTRNWNYTYMGAEAIKPYAVWDDGTFTYFKFYAQQDLPTFFVVNDDGTESVVNKGMERDGDTVVVQRVGKQFVLRMGNSVTCIYNESQTVYTPSSGTETSSDRMQRVIKGDPK